MTVPSTSGRSSRRRRPPAVRSRTPCTALQWVPRLGIAPSAPSSATAGSRSARRGTGPWWPDVRRAGTPQRLAGGGERHAVLLASDSAGNHHRTRVVNCPGTRCPGTARRIGGRGVEVDRDLVHGAGEPDAYRSSVDHSGRQRHGNRVGCDWRHDRRDGWQCWRPGLAVARHGGGWRGRQRDHGVYVGVGRGELGAARGVHRMSSVMVPRRPRTAEAGAPSWR